MHEDDDEHFAETQAHLREVLVPLAEDDEVDTFGVDNATHVNPLTGERYFQCAVCEVFFEDPSTACHSGGECNFCHAMNKDD